MPPHRLTEDELQARRERKADRERRYAEHVHRNQQFNGSIVEIPGIGFRYRATIYSRQEKKLVRVQIVGETKEHAEALANMAFRELDKHPRDAKS